MLSLVNPWLLGGLVLLSLPIAAHLLHRHARRKVVFPTIRLLQLSAASQSQLFKLRRWILLTLRLLVVALIVAAFARPLWLDAQTASGNTSQGTAVVLLLDLSASTGQRADGASALEHIRAAAGRTLDSLAAGTDLVNAVYATAQPHATFPRLSLNVAAIRAELAQLSPTFERADLPRSIALAGEMLSKHAGPRRLVVLTDLQRSNWQQVLQHHRLDKLLPAGTRVTLVALPLPAVENIALSAPRVYPPQPLIDLPAQYMVHVRNFSARAKQVQVDLALGGQPVASQTLTLSPGEQRDVVFEQVVKTAGEQRIGFTIPRDALEADNQAFLVGSAAQRLPVFVVSDDDANEPGTGAYFLSRALAPHNGAMDRYEVRHISSVALSTTDLSPAAAVLVAYLGDLSQASAQALRHYVEGGGGLVYFCGEGSVDRQLQTLDKLGGDKGLLPWPPGPPRNLKPRAEALHITAGKWQSRLLREFDEQSQLAIGQIRFQRVWSTGAPRADAQVLLSFSDHSPALAARALGSGQLLIANFSPAMDASDLGKYGAFVALVQSLAKGLRAASDSSLLSVVGEAYRHATPFPANEGAGFSVLGPDDKPVVSSTSLQNDALSLHIAYPRQPGFYSINRGTHRVATTALNVEPRESDLERIDRQQLLARFEKSGLPLEVQGIGDWEGVLNLHGRPLWGWCLGLAMLFAGLELLCLILWKR